MRIKKASMISSLYTDFIYCTIEFYTESDYLKEAECILTKSVDEYGFRTDSSDIIRLTKKQIEMMWKEAIQWIEMHKGRKIDDTIEKAIDENKDQTISEIIELILSGITLSYDDERKIHYLSIFNKDKAKQEIEKLIQKYILTDQIIKK